MKSSTKVARQVFQEYLKEKKITELVEKAQLTFNYEFGKHFQVSFINLLFNIVLSVRLWKRLPTFALS